MCATTAVPAMRHLRRSGSLTPLTARVRLSARRAQAKPLLDDLERWLRTSVEKLSRKSDAAGAIQYALNLWPALLRYCDNGLIEIDNSAAERALRGIAIGRRNYLFAGADSGGERAPLRFTPCLAPPSSTVSTPRLGYAMCSLTSLTIPSTALTTSCLGTSRPSSHRLANSPLPSGVITSSGNAAANSRRYRVDAYASPEHV
jgi:hypothetical protein